MKPSWDELVKMVTRFQMQTEESKLDLEKWKCAVDILKEKCEALGIKDNFNWTN